MNRKDQIIEIIKKSDKPISASTLAKQFNVSRQIIVGDIVIIKPGGSIPVEDIYLKILLLVENMLLLYNITVIN